MVTERAASSSKAEANKHRRAVTVLAVLIGACILSTAGHYTHNYLHISHYPQSDYVSNSTVKLAILIFWPLLTAAGLVGFWLYARRRYAAAFPFLAAYSLLGLSTLGHFTAGSPHIAPFWYATIFTDGVLGFAILAYAHWSAVLERGDVRRAVPAA